MVLLNLQTFKYPITFEICEFRREYKAKVLNVSRGVGWKKFEFETINGEENLFWGWLDFKIRGNFLRVGIS